MIGLWVKGEEKFIPFMFEEIVVDGDTQDRQYAYAHVCADCARKFGLETVNTCVGGNVCLAVGCQNETSLVHYIWDYR